MPKSTARTPGGSDLVATPRSTSGPKPSSPKKMLPTPATSSRLSTVTCSSHLPHTQISLDVGNRDDGDRHSGDRDQRQRSGGGLSENLHDCSSFPVSADTGSTSSGAKYRYRPYHSCNSEAGSSIMTTPTCVPPSTSACTVTTRASCPAKKRSWASARRD